MLNDQTIRGAIQRARATKAVTVVRDTGKTRGLEFRAWPTGNGSFALNYTPKGTNGRRRFMLGVYSQHYGIGDARRDAATARLKITAGIDPVNERQAASDQTRAAKAKRDSDAASLTVAGLVEKFAATRKPKQAASARRMLIKDLVSVAGGKPASAITRGDLQKMIDRIVERGSIKMARQTCETACAMLRWARKREYIVGEPWVDLDLPAQTEPRERVLSAREIRWLWSTCDRWLANPATVPGLRHRARLYKLAVLLGARSNELGEMQRDELDLSANEPTWTLPASRSKNRAEHTVPLPPLAASILADAVAASPGVYLFAGDSGIPIRVSRTANALAAALVQWNATRPEAERIERFTPHDLRRTAATGMEAIGVAERVIEAVLNHKSDKMKSITRSTFAHADLTLQKLDALARWQGTVEDIVLGADPFAIKIEDRAAVIARALARDHDGKPRLRVVG